MNMSNPLEQLARSPVGVLTNCLILERIIVDVARFGTLQITDVCMQRSESLCVDGDVGLSCQLDIQQQPADYSLAA
jgi:hypothetical protein